MSDPNYISGSAGIPFYINPFGYQPTSTFGYATDPQMSSFQFSQAPGVQASYWAQQAASEIMKLPTKTTRGENFELAPSGYYSDYNAGGAFPGTYTGPASPYHTTPNVWNTGAAPFQDFGMGVGGFDANSLYTKASPYQTTPDVWTRGASPVSYPEMGAVNWTGINNLISQRPSQGTSDLGASIFGGLAGGLGGSYQGPNNQPDFSSLFGKSGAGSTFDNWSKNNSMFPQSSAGDFGGSMFGGLGGTGAGNTASQPAMDWSKLFSGSGTQTAQPAQPSPSLASKAPGLEQRMPGAPDSTLPTATPVTPAGMMPEVSPQERSAPLLGAEADKGFGGGGTESQLYNTPAAGSLGYDAGSLDPQRLSGTRAPATSENSPFQYNPITGEGPKAGASADDMIGTAKSRLAQLMSGQQPEQTNVDPLLDVPTSQSVITEADKARAAAAQPTADQTMENARIQLAKLVATSKNPIELNANSNDRIDWSQVTDVPTPQERPAEVGLGANERVPLPQERPEIADTGRPPAALGTTTKDLGYLPGRSEADLRGVNPRFVQAAKEFAQQYNASQDNYDLVLRSGRLGRTAGEHATGNALDLNLIDRRNGERLTDYQTRDPNVFAAYQDQANQFHQFLQQNYPDLAAEHRWGGYFSGGAGTYGAQDIMHHDLGMPRHGMAGGGWNQGLSQGQADLYELPAGGGIRNPYPQFKFDWSNAPIPDTGPVPLTYKSPGGGSVYQYDPNTGQKVNVPLTPPNARGEPTMGELSSRQFVGAAPAGPSTVAQQSLPETPESPANQGQTIPRPPADIPDASIPMPVARPPGANIAMANSTLDSRIGDLVRQYSPGDVNRVPSSVADQTLRDAMGNTWYGGAIRAGVPAFLPKIGVSPAEFDKAYSGGRAQVSRFGGDFGGSGGELPSQGAFTPYANFRQGSDFENRTGEQLAPNEQAALQQRGFGYDPNLLSEPSPTPLGEALLGNLPQATGAAALEASPPSFKQLPGSWAPMSETLSPSRGQLPDTTPSDETVSGGAPPAASPMQELARIMSGGIGSDAARAPNQPALPGLTPDAVRTALADAVQPGRKSMTFSGGFGPAPEPHTKGVGPLVSLSPEHMLTMQQIESGGRDKEVTGSYKGPLQLSAQEFRKYGGTGDIFDFEQNYGAASRKMLDEGQKAQDALGRELSPVEQYMVHQQGLGGTLAHLTNPDELAWKNFQDVSKWNDARAKEAIMGNLTADQKASFGNDVNNLTSRDFVKLWDKLYADKAVEAGLPRPGAGGYFNSRP